MWQKLAVVNKVDLLIIGAQKAGTTSLYRYIDQHPEISVSQVKEVAYFVDEDLYGKGVTYFHSFFADTQPGAKIASGYVHMLACPHAPERVRQYNPEMKFIVLLRHPVQRAWSAYQYAIQMGWESGDLSFLQALDMEGERLDRKNPRTRYDTVYGYNGLYCAHLKHWMQFFPAEQFLLLRSEDLRFNTDNCLESVWSFLGVSGGAKIDTSIEYNRAGRTRVRWINSIIHDKSSSLIRLMGRLVPGGLRVWIRSRIFSWVRRLNTVDADPASIRIPDEVARRMAEYYRDDLRELETRFGIRL